MKGFMTLDPMIKEQILKKIDKLCEEKNLSLCELGKCSCSSTGTIYQWYSSSRSPTLPPLVGICEKFGVTLSEFFAFNENEKKSSLTDKLTGIAKDLETEDLQVLIKVAQAFRKKK